MSGTHNKLSIVREGELYTRPRSFAVPFLGEGHLSNVLNVVFLWRLNCHIAAKQ